MSHDTPVRPRQCDLNRCKGVGAAMVEINVGSYTGHDEDRLKLVVCEDHFGQFRSGGIVGFAWTPVYAHEIARPSPPSKEEPHG
jgi:hypothetical protein